MLSHFLLSLRERHFGNSLVNEQPKFKQLCIQRLAILMLDGTWHMMALSHRAQDPASNPCSKGLIYLVTVFIADV